MLEKIASLTTDFEQHDLAPEGAEMLSGSFTPTRSRVQFAVSAALTNYGTARAALLLYIGQPDVPGARLYDPGGKPLPGMNWYAMGSVGHESGWATTTYRLIELDVDPDRDVTWTVMAGIIGASGVVPTESEPYRIAITPDGAKGYVTNSGSGTVTPVVLGRPGFSFFNGRQPEDEPSPAIATGRSPRDLACDNSHAVVCNFLDPVNQVTIIDVSTDTVLRHCALDSGQQPVSVALSPDGEWAYVTTSDGHLWKLSIATGHGNSITVAAGDELRGVAVAADGSSAFVGSATTGRVHRIALATFSVESTVDVGGRVAAVVAAPDGMVWTASRVTDRLRSIDPATNEVWADYALPYGGVNDLAIVTPPMGQPVRTAFIVFDDGQWCELNIGGVFAGQPHSMHFGELPGGRSDYTGVAVNDYGEIWIVQNAIDRVWKFPGGRITCRADASKFPYRDVFFGEYLDVFVDGAAPKREVGA